MRNDVRWALAAGAAGAVLSTIGAGAAQAAPAFHCEASPLRATVLGSTPIEPVVQGRTGDCATGEAIPGVSLPSLLSASALTARTDFDASRPVGSATGGIASLAIAPSPEILETARQQLVSAINALPLPPISIPLAGAPLPIPGLPSITGVTIDVKATLLGLIPSTLPSLLSADVLRSSATVSCDNGTPSMAGASTLAGLKILGQDVGVDSAVTSVLPIIDSQSISLANVDLSKLKIYDPTGLTPLTLGLLAPVLDQLKAGLAALPPIKVPAALATVTVVPKEQITANGTLTQRALHANITLGGRPILDAVIGEAQVGAPAGACVTQRTTTTTTKTTTTSTVSGQSVADQLLACSDRKLILVDVLKQGGRVKLIGAANRDYVGKKVAIRLRRGNKVVAHATVKKDGSFETTAPLPAKALMASHTASNTLRYRAEIGKELSLPLKLQRRLTVSSLKSSKDGKTVRITGRVVGPLTKPVSDVRVVRRVSCRKVVLVKRFKPRSDGTFSVVVPAPKGASAAVYRLATNVREQPRNPRSYPTYTLPRGVALNTR